MRIDEKSKSVAQQHFMGMVRAVQKGDEPASAVGGEARRAAREMKASDVKDFAHTKHRGLPPKKACMNLEDFGKAIVNSILGEDGPAEEQQEVQEAQVILQSVSRLQSSLGDTPPEIQRELTTIRSAAHSLLRMHHA